MIDRLDVCLSGEDVKGPGGVVNASLDKLLHRERRVVNGSWIGYEISPAVTLLKVFLSSYEMSNV